mmetsp:Transcript_8519/g.22454  ORF Transcript_8519/g.22454 Transcript_8519/m.22454 type:complete len:219 (-) Transcript_8519:166-822(-)
MPLSMAELGAILHRDRRVVAQSLVEDTVEALLSEALFFGLQRRGDGLRALRVVGRPEGLGLLDARLVRRVQHLELGHRLVRHGRAEPLRLGRIVSRAWDAHDRFARRDAVRSGGRRAEAAPRPVLHLAYGSHVALAREAGARGLGVIVVGGEHFRELLKVDHAVAVRVEEAADVVGLGGGERRQPLLQLRLELVVRERRVRVDVQLPEGRAQVGVARL